MSYRWVNTARKVGYNYTLDKENSTENNLVYKGKIVDEFSNKVYDTENNTIVVNKAEKSIEIYDSIFDSSSKYMLNDDGTLICFSGGGQGLMNVGKDKSIYTTSGEKAIADIKIKLAE